MALKKKIEYHNIIFLCNHMVWTKDHLAQSHLGPWDLCLNKSRKENPQKLTQLSSRSHPRHLVGKRIAQKDTIIDITSDSQVNSNFPNWWSPASLTFNNYFYLFLYLYVTWITINSNAPHLKSPKNQKQKSRLGMASNKNYWGAWTSVWSTSPRP